MVKPTTTTVTAKVIVESGVESVERTRNYVTQSLKSACRNIRDGSVVIALYDENDVLIGLDVTGVPSVELQDLVEDMFSPIEDD